MIKKFNDYITEKLSDKLSGFNEEELKKQFLNGDLNINKYYRLCDEYNFKHPTIEETHQSISNYKNYDDMLLFACTCNFIDLVQLAIKNSSRIIKNDFYYIAQAFFNENIDMLKLILDNGANISLSDYVETDSPKEMLLLAQQYYDKQQKYYITKKINNNYINIANGWINSGQFLGIGLIKNDKEYYKFNIFNNCKNSKKPNVYFIKSGDIYKFYAFQQIEKSEELTIDYSKLNFV